MTQATDEEIAALRKNAPFDEAWPRLYARIEADAATIARLQAEIARMKRVDSERGGAWEEVNVLDGRIDALRRVGVAMTETRFFNGREIACGCSTANGRLLCREVEGCAANTPAGLEFEKAAQGSTIEALKARIGYFESLCRDLYHGGPDYARALEKLIAVGRELETIVQAKAALSVPKAGGGE